MSDMHLKRFAIVTDSDPFFQVHCDSSHICEKVLHLQYI
jgi:hypothetical protein